MPTNKQRRATAKRKLERQLERRAIQARRRRLLTIGGASVVVVVAAAAVAWFVFFDNKNGSTTAAATTPTAPTSTAAPPVGVLPAFKAPADLGANCTYPATPTEPAAKPVKPPRSGKVPTTPAQVSVSMTTDQGNIGIQLSNAQTPCTANSFSSLAQQGFFDGTKCHRLTTAATLSVLQCGDPKNDGTGGPGYQFANEYPTNQYPPNSPQLEQPIVYPRGTLAMANAGPGTNGSQFFLVYKDSQLPPQYTVFGTIDATGLKTLDKIAAAGVADGSTDGAPKTPVTVKSVRLD